MSCFILFRFYFVYIIYMYITYLIHSFYRHSCLCCVVVCILFCFVFAHQFVCLGLFSCLFLFTSLFVLLFVLLLTSSFSLLQSVFFGWITFVLLCFTFLLYLRVTTYLLCLHVFVLLLPFISVYFVVLCSLFLNIAHKHPMILGLQPFTFNQNERGHYIWSYNKITRVLILSIHSIQR